jgi:hypothetical protein
MQARPAAAAPIAAGDWRAALGQRERFAEWSALFATELREGAWRPVVDCWVARLAPGFSAAAMHGVIRTGHAVRGIAAGDTPPRRAELADAFASWAASYGELPGSAPVENGAMTPRQALAQVAVVPPERRREVRSITGSLRMLEDFPEFAPVIGLIDAAGDPQALAASLARIFTEVAFANIRDIRSAIVFIHGVTGTAALANLLPHLGAETQRAALRFAWQAGCALYAAFDGKFPAPEAASGATPDPDELVDRAVAHGDEHVIKFTEACLARHRSHPVPCYPAAVARVLDVMRR